MAINYKLRDEIKYLIVCLYNPSASSEETQYTFSSLWDYIIDCGWQLEQGAKVKRFPYHVAPCIADAEREQTRFKYMISALRKERSVNNTDHTDTVAVNVADHALTHKSTTLREIPTAHQGEVTFPNNGK